MKLTTYNDEHLEECKRRAIEEVQHCRQQHPGKPFTLEQVVADLTDDSRLVYVLIHSTEGAELHFRCSFDEVLFDYDSFSRRDWSRSIRQAIAATL